MRSEIHLYLGVIAPNHTGWRIYDADQYNIHMDLLLLHEGEVSSDSLCINSFRKSWWLLVHSNDFFQSDDHKVLKSDRMGGNRQKAEIRDLGGSFRFVM